MAASCTVVLWAVSVPLVVEVPLVVPASAVVVVVVPVVVPPAALCTDNGAMMAWAGVERLRAGLVDSAARDGDGDWHVDGGDDLGFAPRPRWPLDPDAPKSTGAGAAKA